MKEEQKAEDDEEDGAEEERYKDGKRTISSRIR